MGSIGRYIFRTSFGAFTLVCVSMTATIWVTQALRDVDIMTNQRQTILTFIGITGMIVPLLVLIIAPIALVVAVAHVLNKLGADSEIIVMNASGMSPWRLFRPILMAALVVSVMVGFIGVYLAPKGLRELKNWITEVRANLITYIAQPGKFITLGDGLTFHIRERRVSGELVGVFLDDRRNPKEHATVLAERGNILKNDHGTFLLLRNGSMQRYEAGHTDPTIVVFDRYAFDLSQFDTLPVISYSIREKYFWELLFPSPKDTVVRERPDEVRAEIHDRLVAPLYPIVFVIIAYAYLGAPRTTRQSRTMSLLGALGMVGLVRLVGFASTVFGVHTPAALSIQYIVVVLASVLGLFAIGKGVIIEPPALITNTVTMLTEYYNKRFGNALTATQ
jgi:lipopolysaccharide export system permease protein